jgi:hypothetical protein
MMMMAIWKTYYTLNVHFRFYCVRTDSELSFKILGRFGK